MQGTLITVETASAMGKLSAQRRREEKQRRIRAEKALKAIPMPTPLTDRIAMVERQIDRMDELFEKCKDPRKLVALVQAKERLLNAWALLTGFPRPGVRKVSRRDREQPSAEPIPPQVDNPPLEPGV